MKPEVVVSHNWLTGKPTHKSMAMTLSFGFLVALLSGGFLNGFAKSDLWMPVSAHSVFVNHEFWRLWTALFAHADLGHLIGNLFLLLPFTFLLSGYFHHAWFPAVGVVMGGFINAITLTLMPQQIQLIGISGVVYWMGALWLTLLILIDRRHRIRKRIAGPLFFTLMVFMPETYKPEISYISHAVGFVLGIATGLLYFWWNRHLFYENEVTYCPLPDYQSAS